jgi:uncharacterized protein (TIGR00369 family)
VAGELAFPHYNARTAEGIAASHDGAGGLIGFLGLRVTDTGAGFLRCELDVRDELLTPFRNLHGGVIAALCDHVLGTVCYPVIPRGAWAATTEFKVNYLAAVTEGVLAADAKVVALTNRTAVVRIDVSNDGRPVAIAQGTVLVVAPKA